MGKIAQNVINTGLDGGKLLTLTEKEVCSGLDLGSIYLNLNLVNDIYIIFKTMKQQ